MLVEMVDTFDLGSNAILKKLKRSSRLHLIFRSKTLINTINKIILILLYL